MLYVFLIDTSVSMNQHFSRGISVIDAAKSAVELFFKWEDKRLDSRKNQYMLATYDKDSDYIVHELSNDHLSLQESLKQVEATDLTVPGPAFSRIFDYLHGYRMKHKLDTFGNGIFLNSIETCIIVWITDGNPYSDAKGDTFELDIPQLNFPGSDLYSKPIRWDQRLYTIVLRQQGQSYDPAVGCLSHELNGNVWLFHEPIHLRQCIDNCMGAARPPHKVPPQGPSFCIEGVTVELERIQDDDPNSTENTPVSRLFIYTKLNAGLCFPFPESPQFANFVSTLNHSSSPANPTRSPFPRILIKTKDEYYAIPSGFPCDRYNIEPNQITKELAQKKLGTCWTLHIPIGTENDKCIPSPPFGLLRFSSRHNAVNMYLLPYDFPKVFRLYAFKSPHGKTWEARLENYVSTLPTSYYKKYIRVFSDINRQDLIHSSMKRRLSESVMINELYANATKSLEEFESKIKSKRIEKLRKKYHGTSLRGISNSIDNSDCFKSEKELRSELDALYNKSKSKKSTSSRQTGRNIDSVQDENVFSLPVSEMGDYSTAQGKFDGLRDPLEDDETREKRKQTMFGSPYRNDNLNLSIDEADEAPTRDIIDTQSLSNGSYFSSTASLRKKQKRIPPPSAVSEKNMDTKSKLPSLSRESSSILLVPLQLSYDQVKSASRNSFNSWSKSLIDKYIPSIPSSSPALTTEETLYATTNVSNPSPLANEIISISDSDEKDNSISSLENSALYSSVSASPSSPSGLSESKDEKGNRERKRRISLEQYKRSRLVSLEKINDQKASRENSLHLIESDGNHSVDFKDWTNIDEEDQKNCMTELQAPHSTHATYLLEEEEVMLEEGALSSNYSSPVVKVYHEFIDKSVSPLSILEKLKSFPEHDFVVIQSSDEYSNDDDDDDMMDFPSDDDYDDDDNRSVTSMTSSVTKVEPEVVQTTTTTVSPTGISSDRPNLNKPTVSSASSLPKLNYPTVEEAEAHFKNCLRQYPRVYEANKPQLIAWINKLKNETDVDASTKTVLFRKLYQLAQRYNRFDLLGLLYL